MTTLRAQMIAVAVLATLPTATLLAWGSGGRLHLATLFLMSLAASLLAGAGLLCLAISFGISSDTLRRTALLLLAAALALAASWISWPLAS